MCRPEPARHFIDAQRAYERPYMIMIISLYGAHSVCSESWRGVAWTEPRCAGCFRGLTLRLAPRLWVGRDRSLVFGCAMGFWTPERTACTVFTHTHGASPTAALVLTMKMVLVATYGAMWRYVALCGAMWRYVALRVAECLNLPRPSPFWAVCARCGRRAPAVRSIPVCL